MSGTETTRTARQATKITSPIAPLPMNVSRSGSELIGAISFACDVVTSWLWSATYMP